MTSSLPLLSTLVSIPVCICFKDLCLLASPVSFSLPRSSAPLLPAQALACQLLITTIQKWNNSLPIRKSLDLCLCVSDEFFLYFHMLSFFHVVSSASSFVTVPPSTYIVRHTDDTDTVVSLVPPTVQAHVSANPRGDGSTRAFLYRESSLGQYFLSPCHISTCPHLLLWPWYLSLGRI